MSRKGFVGIGLGLLVIIVVAVAALILTSNKPPETLAFEKGAQLTQVATSVLPMPTGPVEPTPLPTGSSQVAVPTTGTSLPAVTAPVSATTAQVSTTTTAGVPAPTSSPPALTPATKPANYIIPATIKIPAINVDTFIERVGLTKEGIMDVPKNIWNTGWFGNGGYRPGDLGNAVIAGHLDAPGSKAVFWDLDKLKVSDKVILSDKAGKQVTFEVFERQVYPYNNAPMQNIFGASTEPHLNLITCGGTFDSTSQNYNKRLVVYTRLVPAA